MAVLSAFSEDDVKLIVSLPYKVGVHISHAEDEDGEGDDGLEMRALEREFVRLAREEGSFAAEIASEVLASKTDWALWDQDVYNIEPICETVIKIMKPVVGERELREYIALVLEVARAVAMAYGEFGVPPEQPKGFMGVIKKIMGAGDVAAADQPMNVSAAEDDSIARIAAALKKYA